jgi:protocatechuate 3,4-dioxygenase beta subunit
LPDGQTPAENARVVLIWLPSGDLRRAFQTTTDEKGVFRWPNLPAGRYQAAALKPGYGRGEWVDLRVQPNAEVQDVTLVLTAGGVLRGQVFQEDGPTPAAGVMVAAALESDNVTNFASEDPRPGLTRLGSTNSQGRFELRDVPPGVNKVFVLAPRTSPKGSYFPTDVRGPGRSDWVVRAARRGVQVKPGDVVEGITLRLRPANGVIKGTVKRADGTPVREALVSIHGEFIQPEPFSAWTDEEGKFTVEGLPPESYFLTVTHPNHPDQKIPVAVAEGQPTTVQVVEK